MPANYHPSDTAEIVKPEFIFNIVPDEDILRELNGGGSNLQNLCDSFQDGQIPLSNNAHVWVESRDNRWLIADGTQNFLIRNEHGELNVYKRPNIDNCTLEYRYFLEINPSRRRPGANEIDFPRYLHAPDSITVGALRNRQTNQLHYLAKSYRIFCEFYEVDWRMIIGLGGGHVQETNMTLDHVYGIPIVPASTFKGAVRSWVIQENFNNKEALAMRDANFTKVFGSQASAGKVQFLPAYPINDVTLSLDIMNPHFPDYYTDTEPPTDTQDPIPINFLTVGQTSFRFVMLAKEQVLINTAKDWVDETLRDKGLGAKTAVGYGYFRRQRLDVPRSLRPNANFQIPPRTRSQRPQQISLNTAFQQFSNDTTPDPQLVDITLVKNCAAQLAQVATRNDYIELSQLTGIHPTLIDVEEDFALISKFGKWIWDNLKASLLSARILELPRLIYSAAFRKTLKKLSADELVTVQEELIAVSNQLEESNGNIASVVVASHFDYTPDANEGVLTFWKYE